MSSLFRQKVVSCQKVVTLLRKWRLLLQMPELSSSLFRQNVVTTSLKCRKLLVKRNLLSPLLLLSLFTVKQAKTVVWSSAHRILHTHWARAMQTYGLLRTKAVKSNSFWRVTNWSLSGVCLFRECQLTEYFRFLSRQKKAKICQLCCLMVIASD